MQASKQTNYQKHTLFAKGIIPCLFALLLSFGIAVPQAQAAPSGSDLVLGQSADSQGLTIANLPSFSADYLCIVNDKGRVYYEHAANSKTQIASITKVMTAFVALKYGDTENTQIHVSEKASKIGESSAMLKAGDTLKLENAVKALMICSGNDAAQAIAESMGGDVRDALKKARVENVPDNNYDAFVFAMNFWAKQLGMNDTLFANPHGLDFDEYQAEMYSTSTDVAKMCQAAMQNEVFKKIVATDKEEITVNREGQWVPITLESTDLLLGNYNGACGIKTGYTEKAGECFAGASNRNGEMLYAIVLHSESETSRFTDCKNAFNWVYNNTINYPLVNSKETTTYKQGDKSVTVPVVAHVSHKGWVNATFKATLADPDQKVEVFALQGNVSQDFSFDDVTTDVHPGQKVGTVKFMQHNEVVATADVVAAEECRGPNFFEGIGTFFDRLVRGFTGQQTEAKSTIVNEMPLIYGSGVSLDSYKK